MENLVSLSCSQSFLHFVPQEKILTVKLARLAPPLSCNADDGDGDDGDGDDDDDDKGI